MSSPLDGNGVLHMNEPVWVWLYDYGPATHPEGWKHDRSGVKAYPQAHTYAFRTEAEALAHPAQMGWAENHPYVLQKTHLNRSPAPSQTAVEPVALAQALKNLTEGAEQEDREILYAAASTLTAQAAALVAAEKERNEAWGDLSNVAGAIGSVRFMDPPDGGDVTLAEQVARMREALEAAEQSINRYAWERDKAREERDQAERRSEAFWKARAETMAGRLSTLKAKPENHE